MKITFFMRVFLKYKKFNDFLTKKKRIRIFLRFLYEFIASILIWDIKAIFFHKNANDKAMITLNFLLILFLFKPLSNFKK
jgi:hypothetical protein